MTIYKSSQHGIKKHILSLKLTKSTSLITQHRRRKEEEGGASGEDTEVAGFTGLTLERVGDEGGDCTSVSRP